MDFTLTNDYRNNQSILVSLGQVSGYTNFYGYEIDFLRNHPTFFPYQILKFGPGSWKNIEMTNHRQINDHFDLAF